MGKEEKAKQGALTQTLKKAKDKNRICCYSNCQNYSINSHVLQKNGILNSIEQDKHIWLSEIDFFNFNLFHFKRVGINKAFTFKGFCTEHDKKIFAPIEDNEIDFDNYNNLLLFTYRTVLNEKVKKEVVIDWYNLQKESRILSETINIERLNELIEQQKKGIKDIEYIVNIIETDIETGSESFIFKTRFTKAVEICLTSYFTYETTRMLKEYYRKNRKDLDLLTEIFISFFPIENENVLIMGYLKEQQDICSEYVNSFFDCTEDIFFDKLSDLLLCRCEIWACSERFYYSKIKQREKQLNKIIQESVNSIDEDRTLELKLFDLKN